MSRKPTSKGKPAMRTTPTGIPYIDCPRCGINHPENRLHCHNCNSPSMFVHPERHLCLKCDKENTHA